MSKSNAPTAATPRIPRTVRPGWRTRLRHANAHTRALIGGPRLVFADEPTGSLDSLTGEQVMDLLVDSARGQGATVVLVTHEARIAAYADREIMVRDGRVTTPAVAS